MTARYTRPMHHVFWRHMQAAGLFIALLCCCTATEPHADSSARALESRLFAPCCYAGALDMHQSELASDLRKEIQSRMARGDSAQAIQNDLVQRYGERIVATRSDAPLRTMGALLSSLMVVAGVLLAVALRRWTRKEASSESLGNTPAAREARDELDERLDSELADLDR